MFTKKKLFRALIALAITLQFAFSSFAATTNKPALTCDNPTNQTVSGYIYKGAESGNGGKTVYIDVLYQNTVVTSQTITVYRTGANYSIDLTGIVPQCSNVSVGVSSPQLTFAVAVRTTLLGDSTFDGGSNPTYFANQNNLNFYGE